MLTTLVAIRVFEEVARNSVVHADTDWPGEVIHEWDRTVDVDRKKLAERRILRRVTGILAWSLDSRFSLTYFASYSEGNPQDELGFDNQVSLRRTLERRPHRLLSALLGQGSIQKLGLISVRLS